MNEFLGASYKVKDFNKALKYYSKYFGFKVLSQSEDKGMKRKSAVLGFPEVSARLTLLSDEDSSAYNKGAAYGHIALKSDDIYKTCEEIKNAGGNVTRPPGPVKGGTTVIAFVEDPDGYKIELIERDKSWVCRFLHVMLRIGNLDRTKAFYNKLGMNILRDSENTEYKYTLAFAGYKQEEESTVLEFTYNWGVESYDHGNTLQHLTIAAVDLKHTYETFKAAGKIISEPTKECDVTQFVGQDPDGYKFVVLDAKEYKAHKL